MPQIAARDFARFTTKKREFTTRNGAVYAKWVHGLPPHSVYAVYSWGDHWPLFVWCEESQTWWGNNERAMGYGTGKCAYSTSTQRHQQMAEPNVPLIEWVNCETLREIITFGGAGQLVKHRMAQAAGLPKGWSVAA